MIQGQFDVGDGFVYQNVFKCFGDDVLDFIKNSQRENYKGSERNVNL